MHPTSLHDDQKYTFKKRRYETMKGPINRSVYQFSRTEVSIRNPALQYHVERHDP